MLSLTKSLNMYIYTPLGYSEAINLRTDNTMTKRKGTNNDLQNTTQEKTEY